MTPPQRSQAPAALSTADPSDRKSICAGKLSVRCACVGWETLDLCLPRCASMTSRTSKTERRSIGVDLGLC